MKNPEHREARKEYKIREATPADAAAIARIQYDDWIKTYPNEDKENEQRNITEEDVRVFLGDIDARIQRRARLLEEETSDQKTFVAEEDAKIIGFCTVERKEEENRLNALYIDLAYEGKGVASKLAAQAFAYLGDERPMTLEVATYNKHAQAIYEHYGFEKVGEMDFHRPINGKTMRLDIMRRPAKM